MAYNHANQYRSTIIRGKAKTDLDNLLPAYAQILNEICPIGVEAFAEAFNRQLKQILPAAEKKTLDNHRTEIAGKLFGMFYVDEDYVYASERTAKFLNDNDQPAFFKDCCYKLQFPNGMDKPQTLHDRMSNGIACRPLCLVVMVALEAEKANMVLNQLEIGYYVLNNLDALSGRATPQEIVAQISNDRSAKIARRVENPGKAESYNTQHIREQINYLELANLVRNRSGNIFLNQKEKEVLELFAEKAYDLGFDVYSYDLGSVEFRDDFYRAWGKYYSEIAAEISDKLETSIEALQFNVDDQGKQIAPTFAIDTTVIGDEGEFLVFNYEKKRVSVYDRRLVNKINLLGKTKGLGYDIQSIFADESVDPEFVKYIEVKSTKRVTSPDIDDGDWVDTLTLTRNEWVAATQHKESYEIYRVYFTQLEPIIFIIKNPFQKNEENRIRTVPTHYRLDFGSKAVDKVIEKVGTNV